jgi:hypothetical protein
MVGMLKTWSFSAIEGFSSTSSLPIKAFPAYSCATSSIVGAKALQGPHQVAQKSMKTSLLVFTVSSKLASVTEKVDSIHNTPKYPDMNSIFE